jgi:quercetin dioxygenase-like cupin family protein
MTLDPRNASPLASAGRHRLALAGFGLALMAVWTLAGPSGGRETGWSFPAHCFGNLSPMATVDGPDHTARPLPRVTPILCQKLPNVLGKSITLALVDFPPGAYSSRHRHPGSVTNFVLKGAIRSQLAGGLVETLTAGGILFEPPGTIHLFAENASATEPAELLAIFVADDDCGPLTIRD